LRSATARPRSPLAKEEWVNLCWNAIKKDYDITPGKFPLEPVFLDVPLPKLLEIGFGPGGVISSMDHPVIQQLLGFI
jgi:hypothetical protein